MSQPNTQVNPLGSATTASVDSFYTQRAAACAGEVASTERVARRLANTRLVVFLLGVSALAAVLTNTDIPAATWWGAAAVAFACFAVLVGWHDRVLARQRLAQARQATNLHAGQRARGELGGLPGSDLPAPAGTQELSRDLQLFGPSSLAVLLGTVTTPFGRAMLGSWLTSPAEPAEIAARQPAVKELAEAVDLRQELEARGRLLRRPPVLEPFVAWAESGAPRRFGHWPPAIFAGLSALLMVGWLAGPLPGSLVLLFGFIGLAIWRYREGVLGELLGRLESGEGELGRLGEMLARLARHPAVSPRLVTALAPLAGPIPASSLAKLAQLAGLATLRHSSVHGLVNAFTLWDHHLAAAVETWRLRHGHEVRGWLTALGEAEALAALAAVAHEHPDWCFPHVTTTADRLSAEALAHPLIPPQRRVANDVTVGPAGSVLLVTGSNMAGKSTLLRALGTNVVLAQAGGPVCARQLTLPPVVLGTSLLTEDSLTDGVSFFLAELARLKAVVDLAAGSGATAEAQSAAATRRLLYLLDEVLRGTNSAERRIAVERVLTRLLAAGAIGVVTTHDLALADSPELAGTLVPVHFREHFAPRANASSGDASELEMRFDYVMRPGVAPTTNALVLLRMVGLG